MKSGFVIVSNLFHREAGNPILVSTYKKDAIEWLENNGWAKCKGRENKGLWEKEIVSEWDEARWHWAAIEKVDRI